MKKANKGHEGQTKARESTLPNYYNFFTSRGLFGVSYSHVSLVLNFRAKKAALVARKTKLQTGKLVGPKIISYHLVSCFTALFVQILTPH